MSAVFFQCSRNAMGRSLLLLVLFSLGSAPWSIADTKEKRPGGFEGLWDTSFGQMKLTQSGGRIEGEYGLPADRHAIRGLLENGKFTFTYTEKDVTGEGSFELAPDGLSFSGTWRQTGSNVWHAWRGARAGTVSNTVGPFNGLFRTTYGSMRLRQTGDKVAGIYSWAGGSKIQGTVTGKVFNFTYDQPDGEKGEGVFTLNDGNSGFTGKWKGGPKVGGDWSGSRIASTPGRIWLVVIEAPWERGLEQDEYSYGEMLRSFLSRAPNVKVRHRFFNSQADLRKWCGEVAYLPEPVVLYISSHGTKEGVSAGGKVIGADAIIDCVRDLSNLRLLHFGACYVVGGEVPGKIHQASGGSFPISGFDRSVDWAASAIVDFTYMELVLVRGLAPAEALKQTQKMVTFSRQQQTPGEAIPATGLLLIEPPRAGEKKDK